MTKTGRNGANGPLPLEGIRILEYATFHAGPGAGGILGDLGAEIVKIEAPAGDPMRSWAEMGGIEFSTPDGQGLLFEFSNRNKKSLCLDIKKDEGREIFHRLIRGADIFIINLRKSTKIRLGLDYQTLSKINPRIIHVNISGFGPEGFLDDHGAFDPMGQARSGMMFLTGGQEPKILHLAILDQSVSIMASHAVMTALFHRERRSVGQEIHVSLYSTALWIQYANLMMAGCIAVEPIQEGRTNYSPLRNTFCCGDGQWIMGAHHPEERYWGALFKATGREDFMKDPRFSDEEGRRKNRAALVAVFDEVFKTRPRDEWLRILREHRLMFGPVQRISDVLQDPQALENDYVVDFNHPTLGPVQIPGYPTHFSSFRPETRSAAPELGEHTRSIMLEMGYKDEEIQRLMGNDVIR